MTQTLVGIAGLSAILSFGLDMALPPVPNIVVHSIAFDGGKVTQDRTVSGENGVFWAQWTADVVDAATREPLPFCHGADGWNYQTGRKTFTMDLARWTGNPACTLAAIPPGEYYLQATWQWGGEQTAAISPVFKVGG